MNTGIYTAVYSGVPVYETIIQDVAVMRRRADSYMNATQILKLAGLDKGKRSRVLDREILVGEHEKVQGGYGKFQGTWIPPEQSRLLAERYGVLELLRPIMDFEPPQDEEDDDRLPTKEQAMAAHKRLAALNPPPAPRRPKSLLPNTSAAAAVPSSPQSSSRTSASPNPPQRHSPPSLADEHEHKRARTSPVPESSSSDDMSVGDEHRSLLASIFLSDDIPPVLESTSDFGINLPLDELGNTALHWASALARIRVMQHLLSRGANLKQMNFAGETPLMRTVTVPNAYETGTFHTILNALLPSITSLDNRRQTVLHHAALAAGIYGRARAATYYMRHILQTVGADIIANIINLQNDRGDTALNVAAQVGSAEIMDLLIQAGADKGTENYAGLTCSDYFEGIPERDSTASNLSINEEDIPTRETATASQRGREIVNTVQKIVNALDEEYGAQLNVREEELRRLDEELQKTNESLEKTRKELEARQKQSQKMIETQQRVRNMELAIRTELEAMVAHNIKAPESIESIDQLDVPEDIDANFVVVPDNSSSTRIREQVQRLQASVLAYTANASDLRGAVNNLKAQLSEKESQSRKLIAACCGMPVDKIDELVESLMQAIESDPPDLDLGRVVGFMEKIRRQGAFTEGVVPLSSSSTATATTTTITTMNNNNDATIPNIALPEPATR